VVSGYELVLCVQKFPQYHDLFRQHLNPWLGGELGTIRSSIKYPMTVGEVVGTWVC